MIQTFKKDEQYVGLSENKSIYKLIMDLNIQYDCYYMQFPLVIKNSKGIIISNKLSKLVDMIACIYFQKEIYDNQQFINNMYLILKQIEFHIKILNKERIISKKQLAAISRIMADLGNGMKERLTEYQK